MASHAEALLAGKRWLPAVLQTPNPAADTPEQIKPAEPANRAAE
jgi:hypothetical protein